MALLLEIGDEVIPEQSPELVLSRSGRQVSSLLPCPLVLCTMALDAQVGQEGIGEAHQMQVCHGGPDRGGSGTWPSPSSCLLSLKNCSTAQRFSYVRIEPGGGECRGIAHESEDLPGRPFREKTTCREPRVADLQPASIKR